MVFQQSARRYYPPFSICGYPFTLLADPSGNPRAAEQAAGAGAARIEKGLSVYLSVFFPGDPPNRPWAAEGMFPGRYPPPPLKTGPGNPWYCGWGGGTVRGRSLAGQDKLYISDSDSESGEEDEGADEQKQESDEEEQKQDEQQQESATEGRKSDKGTLISDQKERESDDEEGGEVDRPDESGAGTQEPEANDKGLDSVYKHHRKSESSSEKGQRAGGEEKGSGPYEEHREPDKSIRKAGENDTEPGEAEDCDQEHGCCGNYLELGKESSDCDVDLAASAMEGLKATPIVRQRSPVGEVGSRVDPHGLQWRCRRWRRREGHGSRYAWHSSKPEDHLMLHGECCAGFSLTAVNKAGGHDVTWISSMDADRFYPGRTSWGVHCLLPTSVMQVNTPSRTRSHIASPFSGRVHRPQTSPLFRGKVSTECCCRLELTSWPSHMKLFAVVVYTRRSGEA